MENSDFWLMHFIINIFVSQKTPTPKIHRRHDRMFEIWDMSNGKVKFTTKKWVRWISIEVYVFGFEFGFVCIHYKYNRIGIFRIEETITIFTKAVPKKSKYKLNEDI